MHVKNPRSLPQMSLTIADEVFEAILRTDLAPRSCEVLSRMMPLQAEVIHARWSGESLWSPLSGIWPEGLILPAEQQIHRPQPGDVLLFGGESSEPELLVCYGPTRFASVAGPLAGNPVLTICDRLERLAELGHATLRHGAMKLAVTRALPASGPPTAAPAAG